MDNTSGTVTVWQSGRLAPRLAARPFELTREHALGAALLVLSALVLAAFVAVLENDVGNGALAHEVQRSRAQAEAQCESDQPAQLRGRCIALLNGDDVAVAVPPAATPENTAYEENAARAETVSLLASR